MTLGRPRVFHFFFLLQLLGPASYVLSDDVIKVTAVDAATRPDSWNANDLHYFRKLVRSSRSADENFRSIVKQSQLLRIRRRTDKKMEETKKQLRHELGVLERRPRWTPPMERGGPGSGGNNQEIIPVRLNGEGRRNLRQAGTTESSVSIENLIQWKSATEQRIERLERLLETSTPTDPLGQNGSHGWRNLIRQQEAIDENALRIEEVKNSIARLQESVRSPPSPLRRPRVAGPDFENAVRRSAPVARHQDEITANSRQITSIETSLQSLLRQVQSIRVLPPTDDVTSILRNHEERLNEHDVTLRRKSIDVTSLQHQLFRVLRKGMARDAAIKALQRSFSNSSTARSESSNLFPEGNGPRTFSELQRMVQGNDRRLNEVERQVNDSCRSQLESLVRRVTLAEDKVDEARTRADESVDAVRLQKSNLDEMTNRMKAQRVLIQRAQDMISKQQRSVSRMNLNVLDSVDHKLEAMNDSMSVWLKKQTESSLRRLRTQLSGVKTQVVENKNEIRGARNFLGVQIRRLSTDQNYLSRHIEAALPRFLSDVTRNNTRILRRIDAADRNLATAASRMERIEEKTMDRERALETRVNQNRKSVDNLRSSYFDFEQHAREEMLRKNGKLEEAVIYLNITLHRMRAAAQRQTNRGATLTSQLERLTQEGGRANKKFTLLREQVQSHVAHVANVTMSLRHMISSGISSFRQEVTNRFELGKAEVVSINQTFTATIKNQQLLRESISGIINNNLKLKNIRDKTESLRVETRELQHHLADLDETTQQKIATLNQSLPQVIDHQTRRLVDLIHSLDDKLVVIELKSREYERNSTKSSEQLSSLRRYLLRFNRNLHSVRHASDRLGYRTRNLDKKFRSANKSIENVQKRFNSLALDWQRHDQVIKSLTYQITSANRKIIEETTGFYRFHNTTRQLIENLRLRMNGTAKKTSLAVSEVDNRVNRLTDQLLRMNDDLSKEDQTHRSRISRLETLNGTLRMSITQCMDNIDELQDSVGNLRQTDVTLFESITLHERSLVEHRKLHRNLTVLSDGVHTMINEHAEALDTVRHVVGRLNDTVEEGKEQIEETVATQVQRHLREIKNLRSIMHNFTDLLQTVLTDKLNQDISVASVQLRQRSILESLDSHSASIGRIRHDATSMQTAISDVKLTTDHDRRQLTNAAHALTNHQRQLHDLDAITFRLTDLTSQLNTSLMRQSDEIAELDRFLETNRDLIYDIAELLSNQREDSSKHLNGVEEMINSILSQLAAFNLESNKHNMTVAGLQRWSAEARRQIEGFDTNIEFLDTRVDLIAGALDSLAFVETNITDLQWSVEEVQLTTQQNTRINGFLQKSMLDADARLSEMKSVMTLLSETGQERYEITSSRIDLADASISQWFVENEQLKSKVIGFETLALPLIQSTLQSTTELNDTLSQHQLVILSMLDDDVENRQTLHRALEKLDQNDLSIETLLNNDEEFFREIENFRTKDRIYGTTIAVMVESTNEMEETLMHLQGAVWSSKSRLTELTLRADDVEDQVSFFEAKLSQSRLALQSSARDLAHKMQVLESNVTDLTDVIDYLEYDVDNAYNFTQRLFEAIHEQEDDIDQLNRSLSYNAFDVFTSIASSIASVEESIDEVNHSLSADVIGISSLLVDFQLAFDTSLRTLEGQHHELNILAANSSNYFGFLNTAIDYLKQIAHETTGAVGENRNRVQHLNNTVYLLQLGAADDWSRDNSSLSMPNSERLYPGGVFPASLMNGDIGELRSGYDDYYGDDYDDDRHTQANFNNSPSSETGNYPAGLSYDISAVLSGEADQIRIERKLASILDNSYVEYEDYDDDIEYNN